MNFEEAEKVLEETVRSELRDHAFGDREVTWMNEGGIVATGYFGSGMSEVSIGEHNFVGSDAYLLSKKGVEGKIERNDETGPDEYNDGDIMVGLRPQDVLEEITARNVADVYKKLTGEDLDLNGS